MSTRPTDAAATRHQRLPPRRATYQGPRTIRHHPATVPPMRTQIGTPTHIVRRADLKPKTNPSAKQLIANARTETRRNRPRTAATLPEGTSRQRRAAMRQEYGLTD